MRNILIFLSLLAYAGASYAQDASHFAFVSEYIRELGATERNRANAEQDLKEARANGGNIFSDIIRNSTRTQLELHTSIGILRGMHLSPRFDGVIENVTVIYEQKIELHQRMVDIASIFLAGPKPDVDYGKLSAEMPKITALLEHSDRTLFDMTPLVFATLIDPKEDRQGHVSHLVITKEQRKQLLRQLSSQFGSKLDAKNQNYTVSSASVLRAYLRKDFKNSDDAW